MKNHKYDFLDPAEQHTLNTQECEMVSYFRFFTKSQKQTLMQLVFTVALNDSRITRIAEKRKSKE